MIEVATLWSRHHRFTLPPEGHRAYIIHNLYNEGALTVWDGKTSWKVKPSSVTVFFRNPLVLNSPWQKVSQDV